MQVNITKRIDTPEGKRYCPVIIGPSGRIKPHLVMVNDRQEKHPERAYYLDWNEEGKRRRMSVGTGSAAACNNPRETDGRSFGYVDIFSSNGEPERRLEHGDWINAPWGVALAPLRELAANSSAAGLESTCSPAV